MRQAMQRVLCTERKHILYIVAYMLTRLSLPELYLSGSAELTTHLTQLAINVAPAGTGTGEIAERRNDMKEKKGQRARESLINKRSPASSMQMFRHHSYVMWVNPIITCLPSAMRATYAATDTLLQMQRYRYKHG